MLLRDYADLDIRASPNPHKIISDNTLRDLGLGIEDRQILLAHSSSQMTKVYTHPNFKLALDYVNRIPNLCNNRNL